MNSDIYISSFWFYIGLILFLISLSKDTLAKRRLSVALFAIFCFITCFKSGTFNQDIANYVVHFDGIKESLGLKTILLHWNFEPGYNLIVKLIALIYMFFDFDLKDEGLFIFLITLLPSLIFVWQFLKYRYSPSVILFIYATMILISSSTIIRHYYALAIMFVILNRFILDSKRAGLMLFSPILFHYTTIPLVFSLVLYNIKSGIYNKKLIIGASLISIIGFVYFGLDLFNFLVNKAYSRVLENSSQQGGLRNILNLCILFLMFLRLDNFSLSKERILDIFYLAKEKMNLLLWISVLISVALIPLYGLNRVTSFFSLVFIVYFFKNQKEKTVNWVLSLLALASLVFFYFKHTVLSDASFPQCYMYVCEAFYNLA
jgi:hypothetical protein